MAYTTYFRCAGCRKFMREDAAVCPYCGCESGRGERIMTDLKKETRDMVMLHMSAGRIVVLHIWTREPNRGKYVVGKPAEKEPKIYESMTAIRAAFTMDQLKGSTKIGWTEDDHTKAGV
jgi:hypothetical protein